MALDFTTFESTIQTKMDAATDPKELFLLAKTIESTIDNQTVSDITNAGDAELTDIATAGDDELSQIATAGDDELSQIATAGSNQVTAVNSAGSTQVSAVNTAGSTQVSAVNTEGTTQVSAVNSAGTTQVSAVNTAGSTQVSAVNSAGTTQINLINNALDGATVTNAFFDGQTTANLETITSSSGNATIDVSTAYYFKTTITENTVFTFSGVDTGKVNTITLFIINGGNYTVTWPGSVNWSGGTAPTLTASGGDILTFFIEDDTTWKAFRNAANVTF